MNHTLVRAIRSVRVGSDPHGMCDRQTSIRRRSSLRARTYPSRTWVEESWMFDDGGSGQHVTPPHPTYGSPTT